MDPDAEQPQLVIRFTGIDFSEYYRVLEEGYSSEIVYTIRIRNKSFPSSLRPSEKQSWIVKKKAVKEFLTGMYIISEAGREEAFTSRQEFSDVFFSCRTPVPEDYLNKPELVIEAKASADLIRRPKPLSLLDPFFTSEITETGWVGLGD